MEKLRQTLKVRKERAILVAAVPRTGGNSDNLAELTALAESAGAVVCDKFQQKIRTINPATYIGKGKAEQLGERVKRFKANVVIFDNDLSPRQIRELEKVIEVKVLDRSELILDIFATRAKTRQARLQVELAQLEYTYPRLTRMWPHLDAVAGAGGGTAAGAVGGIGTRGPGEQQLEIDRRLVNKRITELKRQLAGIDRRKIREIDGRKGLFKICLVGYTNAGKSTILNALTNSDALVEDRLFATLDTRTRKWTLLGGAETLISDTIGFIQNLPHQLVASFKATLEEAVNADLLLHIVDVSNPRALKQIESVKKVLAEIGCGDAPTLEVFNKVDIVRKIGELEMLQTLFPDAVCISAKTGLGLELLNKAVLARYKGSELLLHLSSSQSNSKVQSFLRAYGTIIKETYHDGFVVIDARLGQNQLAGLKRLGPESIEINGKSKELFS
ncbi:MAG: GTPase HflX [Planctomycetota bacterium]|nr:MAG: GTPase HflX [Planctomycetota bacterium]